MNEKRKSKLLSDLEKAVVAAAKYGINPDEVVLMFTFETLVSQLIAKLIFKYGEEKFWNFFQEVCEDTSQRLTQTELENYKSRFEKILKIIKQKEEQNV